MGGVVWREFGLKGDNAMNMGLVYLLLIKGHFHITWGGWLCHGSQPPSLLSTSLNMNIEN